VRARRRRRRAPPLRRGTAWLAVAWLPGTWLAGVWLLGAGAAVGQPAFTDIAAAVGLDLVNVAGDPATNYIIDSTGNGGGLVDYDGDGDLDVFLAQGATAGGAERMLHLYRNDGASLVDVSDVAGLTARGWANGLCSADVDDDGDEDVYLTAHGPNLLLLNDGRGGFAPGDPEIAGDDWSSSCAFADYDGDGRVDLYVANYVVFEPERIPPRGCQYLGHDTFCGPLGLRGVADRLLRNLGGGAFADVTEEAGIGAAEHYGLAVLFADLDGDDRPDVFVANDSQPNDFFHNRGDGTFQELGLLSGLAISGLAEAQAAMGVDIGDIDGDGDFDLFITNFSQDHNTLYRNGGPGVFADVTFASGLGGPSMPYLAWGTGLRDFDNDGLLDLFVANGHIYEDVDDFGIGSTYRERNLLFLNRGGGRFEDATAAAGSGLAVVKSSRGAAFGDLEGDGDVDILVVNMAATPTLLRNDGPGGGFLTLRLLGGHGNRDALGAVVRLTADGRSQVAQVRSGESYLSSHDARQHFGLGAAPAVEALTIRWPDAGRRRFAGLPANRVLVVPEGA
jgi:enediyne biosynthesis protein E4